MSRKYLALLLMFGAALVSAGVFADDHSSGSSEREIRFLACVDFLVPPGFPRCVSRESNGDTIEATGSGAFVLDKGVGGDIEGRGTLIHRNAAGVELARGTWEAKKFLAYKSYGCVKCPGGLLAGSEGGNLLFAAKLQPAGGAEFQATIEINCGLGDGTPPNRLYDGVEPRVLGLRFDQAQNGATLFIRE